MDVSALDIDDENEEHALDAPHPLSSSFRHSTDTSTRSNDFDHDGPGPALHLTTTDLVVCDSRPGAARIPGPAGLLQVALQQGQLPESVSDLAPDLLQKDAKRFGLSEDPAFSSVPWNRACATNRVPAGFSPIPPGLTSVRMLQNITHVQAGKMLLIVHSMHPASDGGAVLGLKDPTGVLPARCTPACIDRHLGIATGTCLELVNVAAISIGDSGTHLCLTPKCISGVYSTGGASRPRPALLQAPPSANQAHDLSITTRIQSSVAAAAARQVGPGQVYPPGMARPSVTRAQPCAHALSASRSQTSNSRGSDPSPAMPLLGMPTVEPLRSQASISSQDPATRGGHGPRRVLNSTHCATARAPGPAAAVPLRGRCALPAAAAAQGAGKRRLDAERAERTQETLAALIARSASDMYQAREKHRAPSTDRVPTEENCSVLSQRSLEPSQHAVAFAIPALRRK